MIQMKRETVRKKFVDIKTLNQEFLCKFLKLLISIQRSNENIYNYNFYSSSSLPGDVIWKMLVLLRLYV